MKDSYDSRWAGNTVCERLRQKACGFVVSASTWFAFLQIPPRISSDRTGQHGNPDEDTAGDRVEAKLLLKHALYAAGITASLDKGNILLFEEKQRRLKIMMETDLWLITQSSTVAAFLNKWMWVGPGEKCVI